MDLKSEFRQGLLQTRNWKSIIDALSGAVAEVEDGAEKAAQLFELGVLCEQQLLRHDLAVGYYREASSTDPTRADALARARAVLWEQGNPAKVKELISLELEQGTEADRQGELHHQLGIVSLVLGDLDAGLDSLRLAASALPEDEEIAADLQSAEYDRDDWESEVSDLVEGAAGLDTQAATRRLLRAARIVHLESPASEDLEAILRNALEFDPHSQEANYLLERYLLAAEQPEELFKLQQQRVYALPDETEQAALYRQLGAFWESRGQDPERGAALYRRALQTGFNAGERFDGHFVAMERVFAAYADKDIWEELFGLVDAGLALDLPAEEKVALAALAGSTAVTRLEDRERAAPYFAVLEQQAPEHEDFKRHVTGEATDAGAAATEESADSPDAEAASATQEAEAEAEGTADAAEAATEAAAAPEEAEGAAEPEPEEAEPEPELEESFDGKAQEFIDAAQGFEAEGDYQKAVDQWRRAAQSAPKGVMPRMKLAEALKQLEKWNAAADAYNDALRKLPDEYPQKQAGILEELLVLYRDQMGLDVKVLDALKKLVALQPKNLEYIDQLIEQLEKMKRLPDLVKALQSKADAVTDPTRKIEIQLDIARTFVEKFSNQAEAIKAFEAVLELDPANPEALSHLKGMYEKRRDWEKLIKVSQAEIELTEDPEEKRDRMVALAQMATDKLKKPAIAAELWGQVLDVDPENLEALQQLEKVYERNKDWEALGDVCERQIALTEDTDTKGKLAQKLGLLYQDKLDDPEKAIAAWKQLLEFDPENRRAQDSLKKLFLKARAYADLEEFYRNQDKVDELIRVLERAVSDEEDETKVQLLFKIATLWQDELGKPDRAVRAYESVLGVDDNNLDAAEALIPLYREANNYKKLVGVLEIQLKHTEDPAERLERVRALAGYYEENLRDQETALARYLEAFETAYEKEWVREEIERLAEETGQWEQLVAAYEAAYEKFDDVAEALPLMTVVARVYEEKLADFDQALATNKRILELDDVNEQAIAALERLYQANQDWENLLEIFEKKVDLAADDQERCEIYAQLARIYEEQIGDPAQAIDAYKAILDIAGEELEALQALDRLYHAQEQWQELAEVIQRELALVDPEDATQRAELKFRLGAILETHLEDLRGAVDSYRDILEIDMAHEGARQALERYLENDDFQLEVSKLLEPIYEQYADFDRQVQVYETQVEGEQDPYAKVDLLLKIGEIHATQRGDIDAAFDAYSRCYRVDPGNETARAELFKVAEIEEAWAKLCALFEEVVEEAPDPSLQRRIFVDIAEIHDTRLDNWEKAVEFFRRALDLDPEDLNTIEALEKLYTRREQWADLLEIYRRKVDLSTEPEERETLYFQIAYLQEEMLGQHEDAIATYREIVAADDTNLKAYKSLDRLHFQLENWHDLADNLSRQLELTLDDNQEQVTLRLRLAELREAKLEQTAAAVDTYREVLELDPDNEHATLALERLLGLEDHQQAVAQILEPIYRVRDDWQKLVGVLEIMVKHSYDPAEKIELLHQIGELYEVAGNDSPQAFGTYGRAMAEEPANEETQSRLERLARELGNWEDLVQLYSQQVEESADEELKVLLLTRLAEILESQVGDLERAAASYYAVLEVDPAHMDSADSLERIFLQLDDSVRLVQVVLRKAEIVMDPVEKKELYFRAAQIQEEVLEDLDAAIGVYNQVLDLDEDDRMALDNLEKIYIRLERWENLKDVYAKKAELAETDEDRKQMLYVLGQVYDAELKDVERAIDTYQSILEIDPEDYQAIQALDRLYFTAERWYDLLSILEREVELAGDSPEVVGLKHRIGQLWEHHLDDLVRAVDSYREALELDPMHEPTIAALDAIAHGDKEPVGAAQVLEPIYESAMEWERLIDLCEVMAKHADDPYTRVELLSRVAVYYETQLDRQQEAFDAYGRAFREEPGHEETVGHLERLAAETGLWEPLAQLYEEQLEKTLDGDLQITLLLRVARVYEVELARPEDAIAKYQRVLDNDPENEDAILALDRLFVAGEKWQELTEILRREITMAGTDEDRLELMFRLGQTFEISLQDMENAIEVYRDILGEMPEHEPTLRALELLFSEEVKQQEIASILEPLYQMAEQFDRLAGILEVQLGFIEDPMDRLAHIQRIAELYEQNLYDEVQAFRWWGRGFAEDPLSEEAVEETERLAGSTGSWEELVGIYGQVATDKADDPDLVKSVLLRMARVLEEEIGDLARAEEAHLRVLEIDPHAPQALEALDRIYTQLGEFEKLASTLHRRVEVADATDEVIELQFRLARLYQDAIADLDRAVTAYQAVLDNEADNAEALEGLERIYFSREQWKELYTIYERMADTAAGDSEMADCYARMAKIASDALEDSAQALDLWNRVLDIRGEDPVALGAMADLYQAAEEYADLVEILERQVAIAESGDDQIVIYERLGRIFADQLSRERDAIDAYHNILGIDPSNMPALWALAKLYRDSQAWEELVDILQRLIEIGITQLEEPQLIELYSQLGEIQGDILMQPYDAIEAWNKVLTLDEGDFKALAALENLYTQEGMWEECIGVLERKARALTELEEQIDVLMQAANIWEDKAVSPMQAAEVYERILQAQPDNMTASANVEQIYRDNAEWEKLADLLMARIEHLDAEQEQVETLQAVARIYEEQMDDPDNAFEVLKVAFSLDYTNEVTAEEFERLASSTNKWNELLAQYSEVVQSIDDVEIKCDLWVKIGRWYGEKLERPDYAIASLQQALQLNNEHTPALAALADFYRLQQQWAELVAVMARHAELEEDPEVLTKLHLGIGELYEDQLQNPNEAIQSYNRALQVDESNLEALEALDRLYRMYQQWEPLVDVLQRKAGLLDDMDDVIALKMQVGELYEDRIDDAFKAIESYKEIVEVEPQHLESLKALEKLYEKTGQMEEYLDVLEQQLDILGSDEERIAKYQQMAATWEEHFDKVERACECYEKILLIDERHMASFRNLERLYRQERKWEEMVDALGRHINAVYDDADRIDLYLQMGELYERELNDPDRAIEAYSDILSFDPDHIGALTALSRLCEVIEDWDRALDILQRLGEIVSDAGERVEIYHRIGKISEEYLGDVDGAEQRYMQALELDPSYLPSMNQLTAIYQNRGDWLKAAKMMVQAEASTQNLLEKTRLLHQAGMIHLERLEDRERAKELLARTVELDPEHVDAAEPLAELYFEEERFAELEPIVDMLVRKSEGKDNKTLSWLFFTAATTAERLGQPDKALKLYQQAYDADSTHLPTLKGMASLLYDQQQWDKSFKIYQTILVHHREDQEDSEITDIFFKLGNIKLQLGDRKKALNMYEKALEVDPGHRDTLLAVMDLEAKLNNWEAVIHAKRSLIDNTADEEERFNLMQDVGDIYHEKLNNAQKALAAYGEALELKPSDHVVLSKCLELYTESKQWKKAVDVLLRFVEMESDPKRRAKYYYTAAVISRDEIKALDESVEYFNLALDDNHADLLKAFEALDRILTQKKDWKNLERNYRRMIKRLQPGENDSLMVMLLHNLGEVYRSRLRDFTAALETFELAAQLEPDNMPRHEILAELYEYAGPDHLEKAVQHHQALIENSPYKFDSYHKLYSIYMEMRQYDKAWCVASALAFLKKAEPEEQQLYEQYKQKGFVRAKQRMNDEMWSRHINSKDESRLLGVLFGLLSGPVTQVKARPYKEWKIKRKDRRDVATDQLLFSKVFNYVSQVLNLPELPELFLRQEMRGGMQIATANEKGQLIPFVVVGADLLQGRPEKELAYTIARELSFLRPEHFILKSVQTVAELKVLLFSAMKMVNPAVQIPPELTQSVDATAGQLQQLIPPQHLEQLGAVVKKLVEAEEAADLSQWLQAVEYSANHAGFILSNDLEVAAAVIAREPVPVGGIPAKEKVKELVLYSISEGYFEVRNQLGLSIVG
jgi:tetratricopeptide (TPR) repeat protein